MGEVKLPETYKKVMAILAITTPFAAGVAWYLWGQEGNFFWFIAAIVIFQIFVGLLILPFTKKIPLKPLENTQQHMDGVLGKVGLAMALASIVAVFVAQDLYTKLVCGMGVIFFGLGGIYMIKKHKTKGPL